MSARSQKIIFFFIILYTAYFISLAGITSRKFIGEQQYVYLADSFSRGRLYFLSQPLSWDDCASFNGHYYWPLGPLPALLLVPLAPVFNFFHEPLLQGYLGLIFLVATLFLVYKISRKFADRKDAFIWAYAFCFASAYLGVALVSWSWYFAQQVAVFFIFWSIYEYLRKKRYWLIGLLMGLVFLSRPTAGLGILFFTLDILFSVAGLKEKFKKLFYLFLPFSILSSLFLAYNYLRFNNLLEFGYSFQIINELLNGNRSIGLFNLRHLPANLYYFFLSGPAPVFRDGTRLLTRPFLAPDPWGMSIFITSPYFLYLFFLKYKDRLSKSLWTTIIFIALPVLLSFGIGFRQFGFRFSLDFLPFLFILLVKNYTEQKGKLSYGLKFLILFSSLINLYFLAQIF